ncbi:hypothetical protein AAG570_013421 [Ranatra chinensis]|uniref:Gustatory receptor n=1 Tax=Ranatra chinensis TaxID=642074 RepID=A0ABD0YQW3_9HEMI
MFSRRIFPSGKDLTKSDVYRALSPAFFFSKLFGLHPYKEDMSRSGWWTLYTLCFSALCFLVPVHFYFKLGIGKQRWYKSELEVSFTKVLLFALFSALGVSVLGSVGVGGGLGRALKAIRRADALLARQGYPFSYGGLRMRSRPVTRTCLVLVICALENVSVKLYDLDISCALYFYVLVGSADTWSFASVLKVIAGHASSLAEELRDPGILRRRLEVLVEVYAELCDAADALSEAFSRKHVVSVSALLLCSTAQLFYLRRGLAHMLGVASFKDVAFLVFMIMLGSLLYLQLFDIVSPCSEASNQVFDLHGVERENVSKSLQR